MNRRKFIGLIGGATAWPHMATGQRSSKPPTVAILAPSRSLWLPWNAVFLKRLPAVAREVLQVLATQIEQLGAAIAKLEQQLMAWHKSNRVSQRLATIPGIGPIIATAIAATVVNPYSPLVPLTAGKPPG